MEEWMFGESLMLLSTLKKQAVTTQIKESDTSEDYWPHKYKFILMYIYTCAEYIVLDSTAGALNIHSEESCSVEHEAKKKEKKIDLISLKVPGPSF